MELAGLYRDIVETSPDGIWVFDLMGRTIFANAAIADMYGVPSTMTGDLTVFDTLDERGREQFSAHLRAVREGHYNEGEVEVHFVRKDGSSMWVLVRESPLRDEHGRIVAILHRFFDYGTRRAVLQELQDSKDRLSEAHRLARIGSWEWDLTSGETSGSPELYALYGMTPEDSSDGLAGFFDAIHEDDRAGVQAGVDEALERSGELAFVARVRAWDGGDWVWIRGRGLVHREPDGRVWMSGTHQDITEARNAEIALEDQVAQNTLLQTVASAANEAVALDDVLRHARALVLLHDDWERGRAFVPAADGESVVPLYLSDDERDADEETSRESAMELALANRAFRARAPVWEPETMLTIAFPVLLDDSVCAVLTITSAPPLYRFDMIQSMVEQVAVQLGRVAERERYQRELADARDQAMEASRQKSEFLATMSHEIRTPLNGVIGLNDLLLRTELTPEQLRLASGVQVASRALLSVINDVLDFSKIEAGKLLLEVLDFEVRPLLDQVIGVLAETARSKGLELSSSCHRDVPEMLAGDPTRLVQVLTNLVSNAVKFTDRGEVVVRASAEPAAEGRTLLRVDVADTGIGIDEADVEGLFAPFTQADASTTRVYGGTGLGLAISRAIVDALGGELSYARNPGGGSVFTFTAVLAKATHTRSDLDDEHASTWPSGPPTETAEGPRRPRVLVVEDNPVNQMVAMGLLESLGYAGQTADDGLAALELLGGSSYDIILMDVQMPRLDGYSTTRRLREREARDGSRVPVIAMTAAAVEGERERCLDAGMDDFLTKPVDPAALGAVLARWLDPQSPEHPTGSRTGTAPASESPVTSSSPVDGLDLERLEMLRDLDPGNTTYLDRAIGNFTVNTHAALDTIRAAVEAGDAAALRASAHRLAGSALNLGVPFTGESARKLEFLGDAGTVDGAVELLPQLEQSLERARAALLAYQASYGGGGAPA